MYKHLLSYTVHSNRKLLRNNYARLIIDKREYTLDIELPTNEGYIKKFAL